MTRLIAPHGSAALNPLIVADPAAHARLAKEAEGLPSIVVSSAAAANAVMLAGGYFNPLTGYMGKAEALSVRFIMDQTSMSPSRRRILLFDACRERQVATRGGSVAGNSLSESFAREVGRHEGTFALFAAAVGGFSYDNRKLRNGVFSGAFIAGMRGGATPDERNMITLAAIADFVNRQVREWRVQLEGSAPMLDDIERHSGTSFDLMPLTLYHPATPDEGGEAR